jgi:hypothetical protein
MSKCKAVLDNQKVTKITVRKKDKKAKEGEKKPAEVKKS